MHKTHKKCVTYFSRGCTRYFHTRPWTFLLHYEHLLSRHGSAHFIPDFQIYKVWSWSAQNKIWSTCYKYSAKLVHEIHNKIHRPTSRNEGLFLVRTWKTASCN